MLVIPTKLTLDVQKLFAELRLKFVTSQSVTKPHTSKFRFLCEDRQLYQTYVFNLKK